MATIGNLIVNVLANTGGFGSGMQKAQKHLSGYEKSVAKAQKITQTFTAVLGAVGLSFGASRLWGDLRQTMQQMDALAKTSDKLGIATERLAGLRFAAEQTGVESKTLDMALQRMVRRVAEAAQGTGEAVKALKEMKLEASKLSKLSPDEQFRQIAGAMGQVGAQADRVRLAMRLFDSEGVALVNTLGLGERGLRDMQREAEQLGIALDREAAAKAEAANDAINRLSKSLQGLKLDLATEFAPQLEEAANMLTEAMKARKLYQEAGAGKMPFFERAMRISSWGVVAGKKLYDEFYKGATERIVGWDVGQGVGMASGKPRNYRADYMTPGGGPAKWGGAFSGGWGAELRQAFTGQDEIERGRKAAGAWLFGGAGAGWNKASGAVGKLAEWAKGLPEQFAKLESGTRRWAWREALSSLWGRGAGTTHFFAEQAEKQRKEAEELAKKRRGQKSPAELLAEGVNAAVEAGTQEYYRASRMNLRGPEVARQQLTEAKRQTGQLVQLVAFARQRPELSMVRIPR